MGRQSKYWSRQALQNLTGALLSLKSRLRNVRERESILSRFVRAAIFALPHRGQLVRAEKTCRSATFRAGARCLDRRPQLRQRYTSEKNGRSKRSRWTRMTSLPHLTHSRICTQSLRHNDP